MSDNQKVINPDFIGEILGTFVRHVPSEMLENKPAGLFRCKICASETKEDSQIEGIPWMTAEELRVHMEGCAKMYPSRHPLRLALAIGLALIAPQFPDEPPIWVSSSRINPPPEANKE